MQQKIRIARFGQRRAERCDEIVRQFADETDRVREHDRTAVEAFETAHGRIERREQLIGRVHVGAGQRIEQRRLAGVRIADQCNNRHRVALARTTRLIALNFDHVEPLIELFHTVAKNAAIELELCFARTAQTDRTTALPFQMRPSAHESRGHVFQLRKLNLQLAFVGARALREDIENETRAIDDTALGEFFEIAFLHRAQRAVDQDQIGIQRLALQCELFGLAGADEIARIRFVDTRGQRADDARARRARELAEFIESDRVIAARLLRLQQQRAFAFARSFEQRELLVSFWHVGRSRRRTRTGLGTDANIARRHDGRDGVLVDHLAHRIAQKHDELIERLDSALQFDAVDEIDRHRHALTPQRIQKRILQRLPLGHGLFLHQRNPRTDKKMRGANLRPDAPVQPAFMFPTNPS